MWSRQNGEINQSSMHLKPNNVPAKHHKVSLRGLAFRWCIIIVLSSAVNARARNGCPQRLGVPECHDQMPIGYLGTCMRSSSGTEVPS